MKRLFSLLLGTALTLVLFSSCESLPSSSAYTSYHPDTKPSVTMRHYPVVRQGELTAWLTSDHRMSSGDYLYHPTDATQRHKIVGRIRASAMKEAAKHDGAFLLTEDYKGPIYPLWEGTEGKGLLYAGEAKGWIPVQLEQPVGVNTWVATGQNNGIGGWSGYPIVIGDPANPEYIAGAMWYRTKPNPHLGGAASTKMMKKWADRLDFPEFVD